MARPSASVVPTTGSFTITPGLVSAGCTLATHPDAQVAANDRTVLNVDETLPWQLLVQPVNATTDDVVKVRVCNISGTDFDAGPATYTLNYGAIR